MAWLGGIILVSVSAFQLAAANPLAGCVAASPSDPYRVLAEMIADETGYRLVETPVDALDLNPEFLIWVVSPAAVSDQDFVEYGLAAKGSDVHIALGIITGQSLAEAEALWRRGDNISSKLPVSIIGKSSGLTRRDAYIVSWPSDARFVEPVTQQSLHSSLRMADCVTISGHGTATSMTLNECLHLEADEVPPLRPAVVSSSGCNTLRFWEPKSIAMAFIRQGAAAYIGFTFSPNSGYVLGAGWGQPYRYTWDEFTIGQVAQVINAGCQKGFAEFPYYYMIGDPRMATLSAPPYTVAEDCEVGGARRIVARGAPAGVVPVFIRGGAKFSFVRIEGVGATATESPFYNSRIQTISVGADRLVLFLHQGGDFIVDLQRRSSIIWRFGNVVSSALDYSLILVGQGTEAVYLLVWGGGVAVYAMRRSRRRQRKIWLSAVVVGTLFALLLALYTSTRCAEMTISSKEVEFSVLPLPGCFLVVFGACLMYLSAERKRRRVIAFCVACTPLFLAMLLTWLLLNVMQLRAESHLGVKLWNSKPVLLHLITLLVTGPVVLVVFEMFRKCIVGDGLVRA